MNRKDIYYQAMLARDHRFDGKFFVGVKTTGIYCRPICPAKPIRKNVEFFKSSIAAEQAGYRPCLRCRPESAPQSPAWIGKSAVVRRAVKVLHARETLQFHEVEFAELFGISARHLRRLFIEEIGKTPKQLSFEIRLNLARKLIVETVLPLAEIAFASGFNSIRRFNDAFKDRFKKTPSKIRRNKVSNSKYLSISLSYRPPFDFKGLMRSYQSHTIGNLEWFEKDKMHRVVEFDGKVGVIAISDDPEKSQVVVEIDFPDTSIIYTIISRVRSLLDLGSDPIVIANALELEPKLKKLLKKRPGIRLPSGWDGFEVAVSAILGQLVNVKHGRSLVADLIELEGKDSGLKKNGNSIKLFPTPSQIENSELKKLKTTAARKRTLIEFSKLIAQKKISLEPTQDVDDFLLKITTISGIGPWTGSYMALKVLRHTDSFPATDRIIAQAMESLAIKTVDQISPWRGYVAALLWRDHVEIRSAKGKEKK